MVKLRMIVILKSMCLSVTRVQGQVLYRIGDVAQGSRGFWRGFIAGCRTCRMTTMPESQPTDRPATACLTANAGEGAGSVWKKCEALASAGGPGNGRAETDCV